MQERTKVHTKVNGEQECKSTRERLHVWCNVQLVMRPPSGSPLKSNWISMYLPCEERWRWLG